MHPVRVLRRHTSRLPLLGALLALTASGASAAEGGGVSQTAVELFTVPGLGLPVTNAMLTSWVVTALVIVFIRLVVGTPKLVPSKGQAVVEGLLSGLREMLEPIVGRKAMPAAFPVLVCLFLFILFHNWSGLFPFIGTIGWGHTVEGHFHLTHPLLRPATSDANGTLALALVSFGAWLIIIFKYAGPKVIWHDLFGNKAGKGELNAAMYGFLSIVFFLVGLIEIVSILIRPVTLSARLFGNVYGGENLLHATSFFPVFYFLELIVGAVQAFVFTLLSAVYIGLICNHGDDHGGEPGHDHAPGDSAPATDAPAAH